MGKGKGKAKKKPSGGATSQDTKKDMSKVKCLLCKKTGHYASQCPSKKKGNGKKAESSKNEDEEEFAARFANKFSLVRHLLGSEVNGAWSEDINAWVVDSGTSSHMT